MTERIRDQRILSFAATTVWATDEATRATILTVLARHYQGVRLSRDEIDVLTAAGQTRPQSPAGGRVAVVPLWGVLVPHAGTMVDMSTPGTGLDEWTSQFRSAVADPNVDTVVIQINSGGGSAQGVQEAAKVVRDARGQKQIVAIADAMAASAAYMIGSQADSLIVTPSGLVGAVHCYSIHEDISAMLERQGVKLTLVGAPNGGSAEETEFTPLSEENLAHRQRIVDQFYSDFVSSVAAGRGIDTSIVEANYGQGRVLHARDALAAGMVDRIASFDDTMQRLLAGKPAVGGARADLARTSTSSLRGGTPVISMGVAPRSSSFGDITIILGDQNEAGDGDEPDADDPTGAAQTQPPAATAAATAAVCGTTPNKEIIMEAVTIDGTPPTIEELAAQQTHLKSEMDDLDVQAQGRAFTQEEQASFDTYETEWRQIDAAITNMTDRANRRAELAGIPANGISGVGINKLQTNAGRKGPQDIFDLSAYRSHASSIDDLPALWRDGAKRANEVAPYRTPEQEKTRAFVEALLDQDGAKQSHDSFAHRMLIVANPAYDAAFGRWVMGRESNADIGMIRMAVSNTGLGSETPVPVTIDPTVLYTGDGARSPLRLLSQVVTITGLKWRGLGSDGVTLAYGTETVAIDPATPTFAAPDVTVVKASGEIQFTVDVDEDWPSLRGELQRMFNQAKFRLEADKFLNGTGANEPTGLIFALDDDGSSVIDTATANTLALSDVIKVNDELPATFDYNATWLAHKAFYSNVAALAAAEGRIDVWVPLTGGFNQQTGLTGYNLLNSPAATASEVSKLFTTGSEEVAVIGDFNQGFVIIDRVGLNVELDLHPRDANAKWTGNRGLVCWFRNNTALRTPNAFRLLRIKHT